MLGPLLRVFQLLKELVLVNVAHVGIGFLIQRQFLVMIILGVLKTLRE